MNVIYSKMETNDYEFAVALQKKFFNEASQSLNGIKQNSSLKITKSLVDPEWELIDPNPDIYVLFDQFNKTFFWNTLSMVEVKWSSRMTLCAGLCCYEGRGSLCSVRLSQPLLKLRPRRDLVETLLHEMIHAYLFITENNKDRDGHGPEFCKHMHRINAKAGTNITIYHSFHDEVDEMRKHWWRCTGRCRNRPPYFGYVKRAMNRPPSKNDYWWADHQNSCGGDFLKIKEPENYGKKSAKTAERKAKNDANPASDLTQRKLPFSPLSSMSNRGHVLGGAAQPRDGDRGIPTCSRLLTLHDDRAKKSGNGNASRGVLQASSQSKSRRKSENLSKVCKELRRTGARSVNENAAAYKTWKVKTKFLTSKASKTIVFESDDELSDEDTTNQNTGCYDLTKDESYEPQPKNHVMRDSSNISAQACFITRDESRTGVKRKHDVVDSHPVNSRSPLKKRFDSRTATIELTGDVEIDTTKPSTSNDVKTPYKTSEKSLTTDLNDSIADDCDLSALGGQYLNDCDFLSKQSEIQSPSSVSCPICSQKVPYDDINTHVDICLNIKAIEESTF